MFPHSLWKRRLEESMDSRSFRGYGLRFEIFAQMVIAICAVLLLFPGGLRAQEYRARLTVTVQDSSGAVVPGAPLELQRGSTKSVTTAKTDATGSYTFQLLEPDTYNVKASAPTLNHSEVTGIVLQAYASGSITVVLKPASATAEVTVTAEGALLETENASQTWNIETQQVQDLPVLNGNPVTLGADLPGVYMRPLGIYTDPWTVTSQYLINGGLMYLNDFQIDGSPNDSELGNNSYAYTPPDLSVKQFSVSANNYDAQYGHTSGGVINLTTMSGGDQYHGIGWGSFRRTGWNANTYQNKYQNAIHDTNANGTPFNTQTQLGFQVGGPITIPHLIPTSQRYKPYFFFAYDHYTELLPRGLLLSYPTAKMRTGDFSELLSYGVSINDPETGHVGGNGDWVRDPFPGNIIPTNRLNAVALNIAKVFPSVGNTPAGQRPGTADLNLPNNFFNWLDQNFLGRFDFDVADKYKFYLRPYYSKWTEVSNAGGIVGPGEAGGHFSRVPKGFLVDFIDTINSSTVLNVRYGYTHFGIPWTSPSNQGVDLGALGYPSVFVNSLQTPKFYGDYNFQNYNQIGWFANDENTGNYSIEGDVTKTLGRHEVRLGWDVRLTHFSFVNPGSFAFNSNSDFTDSDFNNNASEATSGDSFATFLLGTPSNGSAYINAPFFISSWYLAPWIQDDWRVNNKLTVNLGFRYDVLTAPVEKNNALVTGFDPNVPNAVQAQIPSSAYSLLPQASNITGGLLFANVNGNPRSPFPTVYHNIQPRIGFAWQALNRLVIRGGYGLFYTNFQDNAFIQQLGFSAVSPLVTSNDGGRTSIPNVLSNPYPSGLVQPTGSSLGTLTGIGQGLTVYNRNYKIPSANEFSFGLQYRVLNNAVIDAAYVGNREIGFDGATGGQNLPAGYPDAASDGNQPLWNFIRQCDEIYGQGNINACQAQQPNPFQGVPAFAGTSYYSSPTVDAYDLNRPHPEFGNVELLGLNNAKSWYNGLQVAYTQHMTHGISFGVNYVWSKQIEQFGWMNQALNMPQRSPYYLGLAHVFKTFGVYQLPIGRGKLVNTPNKAVDMIVGGLEFSPDFTVQSGEPATLPPNAIPLPHNKFISKPDWSKEQVRGWGGCVLDYVPGGSPAIPGGPTGQTAQQCGTDPTNYDWLTVSTLPFERAQPFTSSAIRMKPTIASDAAIQKTFDIWENVRATVRLQATNVLNRFNILTGRFDVNPNDPPNLFGTIIKGQTPSADAPPRNVNVQFRVNF
jgi:hypothetical protein